MKITLFFLIFYLCSVNIAQSQTQEKIDPRFTDYGDYDYLFNTFTSFDHLGYSKIVLKDSLTIKRTMIFDSYGNLKSYQDKRVTYSYHNFYTNSILDSVKSVHFDKTYYYKSSDVALIGEENLYSEMLKRQFGGGEIQYIITKGLNDFILYFFDSNKLLHIEKQIGLGLTYYSYWYDKDLLKLCVIRKSSFFMQSVRFYYDKKNVLSKVKINSKVINYKYDKKGRLTSIISPSMKHIFNYEKKNKMRILNYRIENNQEHYISEYHCFY